MQAARTLSLAIVIAGCSDDGRPHSSRVLDGVLDGGSADADEDAGQASRDGASLHPYDAGGIRCLDYPDAGYRAFPHRSDLSPANFPSCTPSCHPRRAQAGSELAPLDQDLPSGPCDDEGATCSAGVLAGWCGPCLDTGGPGNGYVCSCREQRWQCTLVSQGAAVCSPPTCLGFASDCRSITRSAAEICGCGQCRTLCASASDCASGACRIGALCFPPNDCPGPAECPATCTGFCE